MLWTKCPFSLALIPLQDKCDLTFTSARREILNRRDRRHIKKGCVTLYKSFRQFLIYFSSCTACAGLDDAPAMFCLSPKKAAEILKF